jgi:predicted ABC-class ATPase
LRDQLLEMTQAIDRQMQERLSQAKKNISTITQAKDIKEAMLQNLAMVDEFFVQAFNEEMDAARKAGDLEKISKLKQIEEVVEKASAPPPEVALIQELLEVSGSETSLQQKLEEHKTEITPEFMDILSNLLVRTETGDDIELKSRLNVIFSAALRFSMAANLK